MFFSGRMSISKLSPFDWDGRAKTYGRVTSQLTGKAVIRYSMSGGGEMPVLVLR